MQTKLSALYVYKYIEQRKGKVGTHEICEKFNINIRTAQYLLKDIVKAGFLMADNSKPKSFWIPKVTPETQNSAA